MKITEVNSIITFFLEDRITVNNAPEIEKEIFDAVEGKDAEIIIDAEKLEYISSAGLSVLMRLAHRKDDDLKIINVSRDVYDILETTGFTEMFDVHKAFRKVSSLQAWAAECESYIDYEIFEAEDWREGQ